MKKDIQLKKMLEDASVNFAKSSPRRKAIITSLYKVADALEGKNGTAIECK
ncbi:hypothetical protein [Sedimentibacter sp.]|uniref:hypothetical protein n=1 Tax=Sedimentibacter sp. TaxID=1960295 RepID=UPI0028AC0019|nr:hypothetical protein [Sedimentibacter sp.]